MNSKQANFIKLFVNFTPPYMVNLSPFIKIVEEVSNFCKRQDYRYYNFIVGRIYIICIIYKFIRLLKYS